MTISFFTDPYKDELIYSAIARYHYYTGNIDMKDTIEELLDKRTLIPSVKIGSNLGALATNLGGKYTAEQIISKHTIFPFYSPFLPKRRKTEIVDDITNKDGQGIYTKLGIVAGGICKKDGIYYCPICAAKEIKELGEPYIHREHQLQGVYLCPHDGAELKKYVVDKLNASRIEYIRLNKELVELNTTNKLNQDYYETLLTISKMAYSLLQLDIGETSKEDVLARYKSLLSERGLTTDSGKSVKQQELFEEFIGFYGFEFLKIMESTIDNHDEYNWLRVATRNSKRVVHPIRQIMLINFLTGDIHKFFQGIKNRYLPFGKGPWPCLNKVAAHYKKNTITSIVVSADFKTKVPVGTFSCSCGFVYSRRGPDKSTEDRFRIGRIKKFGHVWEEKLKQTLQKKNRSLREVAKLMYCDPKTIIKFDRALKLNYFESKINTDAKDRITCYNEDKNEAYKKNLLKVISQNPTASRTMIRNLCQKEYAFLYKNDPQWLMNNLPKKVKEVCRTNVIVDWPSRDIETQKLVEAKYHELLAKDKPVRITKSLLGKSLGILPQLDHYMDKLPKTSMFIDSIVESVEEFRMRRCKKIISVLLKNQDHLKLWEVQRVAGIRSIDFNKIKGQLEEYIQSKKGVLGDERKSCQDK